MSTTVVMKKAGWICLLLAALLLGGVIAGCRSDRQRLRAAQAELAETTLPQGLQPPHFVAAVNAAATPPVDWRREPLKQSDKHCHQVWLSPSGKTAYGVIYFTLPGVADVIQIPMDWVLKGYLDAMRADQGEARLVSRQDDPNLPGVRFTAEGGMYTTYTNLITAGRHGWAVYVGTLRDEPIAPSEFELAQQAREQTRICIPE